MSLVSLLGLALAKPPSAGTLESMSVFVVDEGCFPEDVLVGAPAGTSLEGSEGAVTRSLRLDGPAPVADFVAWAERYTRPDRHIAHGPHEPGGHVAVCIVRPALLDPEALARFLKGARLRPKALRLVPPGTQRIALVRDEAELIEIFLVEDPNSER